MHQFSSDSAVDTTADRPNHSPLRSTDLADAGDLLVDEFLLSTTPAAVSKIPSYSGSLVADHCPVCRTAADTKNELSDDFSSAWRVSDFWMELNTVPWFVIVGNGCEGGARGMPNNMEVEGYFRELISVGHPNL